MTISLDQMMQLARAMVDADQAVEDAEQALKDAKEKARQLHEESVPSAMQELGVESLTLDTGEKLKVSQEVYASIPNENKRSAYTWLNDNGFGGMIKMEVAVNYGKGEQEVAAALFKELHERGLQAEMAESVHASTLKAFLKEMIVGGKPVPLDLFGARAVFCAKITKK